jgi:hypothetical protein
LKLKRKLSSGQMKVAVGGVQGGAAFVDGPSQNGITAHLDARAAGSFFGEIVDGAHRGWVWMLGFHVDWPVGSSSVFMTNASQAPGGRIAPHLHGDGQVTISLRLSSQCGVYYLCWKLNLIAMQVPASLSVRT